MWCLGCEVLRGWNVALQKQQNTPLRGENVSPHLRRKANRFKGNFLTENTHLPRRGRYDLAVKIIDSRSLSSKDLQSKKDKLELFFHLFPPVFIYIWKYSYNGKKTLSANHTLSLRTGQYCIVHTLSSDKKLRYARVLMFRCTILRRH